MKKYPKKVLKAIQEGGYFESVSYKDGILTFKIRVQLSLTLKKMAEETLLSSEKYLRIKLCSTAVTPY